MASFCRVVNMKLPVLLFSSIIAVVVACAGVEVPSPPAGLESLRDSPTPPPTNIQAIPTPSDSTRPDGALALFEFTHEGFRTQVTGESAVATVRVQSGATTMTVRLQNLNKSSGSINSRVTINFGRQFENYIEVPTSAGIMRFYLHRDGSLRKDPDGGSFT